MYEQVEHLNQIAIIKLNPIYIHEVNYEAHQILIKEINNIFIQYTNEISIQIIKQMIYKTEQKICYEAIQIQKINKDLNQ